MKISLGMNLQSGPWGGGNQFGHTLVAFLRYQGVEVYFDLEEPDLDIAILTGSYFSGTYTCRDLVKYLLKRNWSTIVVHRINECDERKGTTGVNQRLMRANFCADYTVFISRWLQDLFLDYGMKMPRYGVIRNGADGQIFNNDGYQPWNGTGKLKLVTHHWGANPLKGFDIYKHLDMMLSKPEFKEKVEFTYIGNLPSDFHFVNAYYISPQSGLELADSIRSHHVYLSASQFEPAGMHHIEGAMCGLPLLYRESGALPEYCNGFGLGFTTENFEQKLQEMIDTYQHWQTQIKHYPYTAERMCENYHNLFVQLYERREEIIKKRQWWRKPHTLARTLFLQQK